MRIVVHGQQAFGKAVLERLLDQGEDVVGVFCAPDKEGRPADPLKEFAQEKGLPLHQPTSWKTEEALALMQSFDADVCMMAYVTLFVPEAVINAPTHGTFQYHPSLLPLHRGPSSINWPIIQGAARTGLSIFWPNDGLDEGPILLQKEVEIGPDDTLGSVYFNHLFPMGVDAMMESLELVKQGRAPRTEQDHSKATYESWCGKKDARIDWAKPASDVYNLIRGCNPAPGAWAMHGEIELSIFDCRKGDAVDGAPGTVTAVDGNGVTIALDGGSLNIQRVRPKGGKKVTSAEYAAESGLAVGDRLV
ncbi:MAG: methionyl-tRNA formyltransferase [Alphaproteobacteria bacterium]|nr:methionyl-tRNA formyltransferase [Alphaproteobacteria bacterium]